MYFIMKRDTNSGLWKLRVTGDSVKAWTSRRKALRELGTHLMEDLQAQGPDFDTVNPRYALWGSAEHEDQLPDSSTEYTQEELGVGTGVIELVTAVAQYGERHHDARFRCISTAMERLASLRDVLVPALRLDCGDGPEDSLTIPPETLAAIREAAVSMGLISEAPAAAETAEADAEAEGDGVEATQATDVQAGAA